MSLLDFETFVLRDWAERYEQLLKIMTGKQEATKRE
jgi:hypothetical protein